MLLCTLLGKLLRGRLLRCYSSNFAQLKHKTARCRVVRNATAADASSLFRSRTLDGWKVFTKHKIDCVDCDCSRRAGTGRRSLARSLAAWRAVTATIIERRLQLRVTINAALQRLAAATRACCSWRYFRLT